MSFYRYPGDVSYIGQNRMKDHYRGTVPLAGLGRISALKAGAYQGAIGRQVGMQGFQNGDRYGSDLPMYAIAIRGVGLGVTDREACAAVASMGTQLLQSTGTLAQAQGAAPTRRAGETEAAFNQRLAAYNTQHAREAAAWTYAGQSSQTLSSLCNLINQAETTAGASPSAGDAAELARLRAEAQAAYLVAQRQISQAQTISGQGLPDWAKTGLVVAGVAAVGAGAYFLLKRWRK